MDISLQLSKDAASPRNDTHKGAIREQTAESMPGSEHIVQTSFNKSMGSTKGTTKQKLVDKLQGLSFSTAAPLDSAVAPVELSCFCPNPDECLHALGTNQMLTAIDLI